MTCSLTRIWAGLHVGRRRLHSIVSRFKRAQGYNPSPNGMGDTFGFPAEQYAMDTGNDPAEFATENIANTNAKINALGFSYDWDRGITTDRTYKWTQWIFTKLYEKFGLWSWSAQ